MPRLTAFANISLDGYFAAADGDISWFKSDDPDWKAYTEENARGGGRLLFGRVTYELMASYWPTSIARQNDPALTERMNCLQKVVFSRTLDQVSWNNTRLVNDDLAGEVRKMKQDRGEDMVILGSGSVVSQLTQEGLIDEYQFVLHPVILGRGEAIFDGIREGRSLTLTGTRTFGNGSVLLCYESAP
jgi:dihydrofolate reductase